MYVWQAISAKYRQIPFTERSNISRKITFIALIRIIIAGFRFRGVTTSNLNTTMPFPKEFLDSHHHFMDTGSNGSTFQKFLAKLVPNLSYLAEDYRRDVIDPLENAGVTFRGSIHMECLPDDGLGEAKWVDALIEDSPTSIRGIIASCDLAQNTATVENELKELSEVDRVKG